MSLTGTFAGRIYIYMKIIIRTIGERTENECIRRCKLQGHVYIVREYPFGKAIKKTYELAMSFDQKWVPVIDADVLLHHDVLRQAIQQLQDKSIKTFCWDGTTNDKIMMKNRRAGIHIYNSEMLKTAIQFIDNNQIKPETYVRKRMLKLGFPTLKSNFVFGLHDYEQYYRDLWRKAICQTKKLAGMVGKRPVKWKKAARKDKDFYVIYEAYKWATKHKPNIIIDARNDFDAQFHLQRLKIKEKEKY